MIIVKPVGGLASQLHKYAVGKALADMHDVELKLDLSWFDNTPEQDTAWDFRLDKFNLSIQIATDKEIQRLKPNWLQFKISNAFKKVFGKGLRFGSYSNESFLATDCFMGLPSDVYIEGEFLGYKYLQSIKEELQSEVQYRLGTSKKMDAYLKKMEQSLKPTVSIHFRRGDFISNPNAANFHCLCSNDFYMSAIQALEDKFDFLNIMVFSDEIEWVESNFSFGGRDIEFVKGLEDFEEFQLMSMCEHNIISNSGFSWFSSWLNRNENIIVAPLNWVKDRDINHMFVDEISSDNVVFLENV